MDWQDELETLLASLDVSIERGASSGGLEAQGMDPQFSDTFVRQDEVLAESAFGVEVSAVHAEIRATLDSVVSLVRSGKMNTTSRDDVLVVMEALTRPYPPTSSWGTRRHADRGATESATSEAAQEWDLTSASAILHLCRLVLAMTKAIQRGRTDEEGPLVSDG